MNFETIEGILNINLNSTMTLALAAVLLIMGYSINKRLSILNKYCIPAPVVGGFIFMFLTWIGHVTGTFKFNFENIFQSTFMLAFFTTVGLGASFALLKKGGKLFTLGSDAHNIKDYAYKFDEARKFLLTRNIKEIILFKDKIKMEKI